jgi:hypothetical protein
VKQSDKPNTRFISCKCGCGERFWGEKPGLAPECKARRKAVASLRLHVIGCHPEDVPEYDAAHEERIRRLEQRAEQGLPLFAA